MCSHCLFPVVDKSGTSCYHLVTRLMRPTDSQQVVPTILISSARNKLLTSYGSNLRTACISLVGTTCSKSVTVINLVKRLITTCSRLVATTGNKQCEHILISAWQQPCYNLFADLEQLVRFYVCIDVDIRQHTTLSFAHEICVSKFHLSFLIVRLKITMEPEPWK